MTHALRAPGLIALLVALHACLTVFLAHALNIWIDEAYTLDTTGSGIAHAVRQAIRFELQPPAFYMLLSVWRKLDPGLFFARLFSVLCAAAAIPVMAMAWRRYERRIHPGWIAAAMAFNPAVVWAAVEARPYALSLLLATALLWLFEMGFLSDAPRFSSRMAYAAVGILALYTQYYLGFLLLGGGVALAVLGRRQAFRSYLIWMLLVLVVFVPLLVTVPGQVVQHTATLHPTPLGESVRQVLSRLEDLFLSTWTMPRATRWLPRGALAVIILMAAREFLTGRSKASREVVALAVMLLVAVGCMLGVQWSLGGEIASKRHIALLLPFGLLLLFRVVAAPIRTSLIASVTALLLFGAGWRQVVVYEGLAKHGDHARVASYLSDSESADEPILVFPGEQALPLAHHYAGRNELIGLPVRASLIRYDPRDFAWRDRDQVVRRLQEVSPSCAFWLVTYQFYQSQELFGVDLRSELLESVVESDFQVLQRREFDRGALVRKLRRRVVAKGPPDGTQPEAARGDN